MKAQQLRNAVLQLAVQGKRVQQDPNDEPASVLLERIREEKERLIKEKKIKKEKPLPEISEDEKPYEIPESWEWVRLGDILHKLTDGTHSTPKYVECGVPFISVKDISSGTIDFSNTKYISYQEHMELYKRCNPEFGDILLTKVGTTGIPVIVNIDKEFSLFVSVALLKFSKIYMDVNFLCLMIKSPLVKEQAKENTRGVGNKNWVIRDIANTIIPLPSLIEQQRITAKIEEIMPLIDEYEMLETELSKLEENFPKNLKKSILQYAVQGKLVEQNNVDEPASVLLEKIKAEKEQLIREKKIKAEKPLPEINDDEKPFEIPDSWDWVRVGEIFDVGTGMTPIKSENEYYKNGSIPWITSSATGYEYINSADSYITEHAFNNTSLKLYKKGTLIMAMYGQGKTRGQISQLNIDATINQACAALDSILKSDVLINYTKIFFKYNYSEARKYAEGSAQPNLNLNKVKNTIIPIPPLEEQNKIVPKVQEIMTLCDILGDDNAISNYKPSHKANKVINFTPKKSEEFSEEFDMVARAESISPETQSKIAERIKTLRSKK